MEKQEKEHGAEQVFGGGGEENKKSTSGGTASTDGLIAFRRYLDLKLTQQPEKAQRSR